MKPSYPSQGLWLLLVAALTASGCTSSSVGSDAACRDAEWTESRMFFGRDFSNGGEVTEEMWTEFVDQVVAPRFSSGFTVVDGVGFWFNETSGEAENEQSKILIVLHPGGSASRRKLDEIASEYLSKFDQHSVLADSRPTCVKFHEGS